MTLSDLIAAVQEFARERDWEKFHTPKNLAMAVTTESAELLEIFQWLTPEQSSQLTDQQRDSVRDELGDVLICLCNLAGRLGIDPLEAAASKLQKNRKKYPIDKARGNAKKYTEL